ncbi:MAG TPA: PilT/PilU family type 4a pilus ATPase [Verrucomicrobiota bacterium]|nr:twitching motility protein PilT [Verrucomicrobiales bacterium]HRI14451.1 PilT/PilU family type 4a pilus ATPase [Verrucomicrobiota bacterium]
MNIQSLITAAQQQGASDLHLEPGLSAAVRIRGSLRLTGDPIPPPTLLAFAQDLLGESQWPSFLERRSADLSRTIQGVRCRLNIFQTARGVGLAIRLLASFQATVETLNLHPDLKRFVAHQNGLILVCGPTGSGKSSTLAALIQEINLTEARHIVTIESPIEYTFRPRRAFLRQREVGRDTPSFEQALLDALREDPDVLMVGELREPETMRLTLNASETGHLVLTTVHSSTCAEALQRIVSSFPPETQASVGAQLADCLVGVIAQRLHYRPELDLRIPECEILMATHAVRSSIRNREFFKIASLLEIGAEQGMWSVQRYHSWVEARKKWHLPGDAAESLDADAPVAAPDRILPGLRAGTPTTTSAVRTSVSPAARSSGRIEIEPVEDAFERIIKREP